MHFRVTALLLAMTTTAVGITAGLKFAYTADVVVLLVMLVLWTAAGFSLGWSTSRWWPEHWLGRWTLAIAGASANWMFLALAAYARSITWDEDAGESRAPLGLEEVFRFLFWSDGAFWWAVGWTAVFLLAAVLRRNAIILAGIGLSLSAWLVVGWWAFIQACRGLQ
jgi:hypothetical protein